MTEHNETIYSTTDYEMFNRLEGNRAVLEPRVKNIIKSINETGYISNPIIVNEKMEVIDGQGRVEAFKRLGVPVEFRIIDGIGDKECIAMNKYQAIWTTTDFIKCYAEKGDVNYQFLIDKKEEYPFFDWITIASVLTDFSKSSTPTIKQGELSATAKDRERANKKLKIMSEYRPVQAKLSGSGRNFYTALYKVMNLQGIKAKRLKEKIFEKQEDLIHTSNVKGMVRDIADIYNHRLSNKVDIAFRLGC